jgi:chemotaxis protein histidine kinase CheA
LTAAAQARLRQLREQIDAALEDLVADMMAVATSERETAISEVRTAAQREADAALQQALEKARAQSEATLAERLAAVEAQAAEAQAADRRAEADAHAAQALEDSLAAERAHAATTLAETLAAERAQAESALAQSVAAERERAASALAEAEAQAAAELVEAHVRERQSDLACMERLLDAVRDLDLAASLSQVFDTLAAHAGAQITRVAVLVVREGELRGWKTSGFGPDAPDASSIALRVDSPTVIGRAAQRGETATTRDAAGEVAFEPLAFASLPDDRVGLAVPLRVGPRTVGVLYADEGGSGEPTVPSAWPEALEILARHAGRCLELQTLARAYALHTQQGSVVRGDMATSTPIARDVAAPMARELSTPAASPPSPAPEVATPAARPERAPQVSEGDASALRYARLLISEIKLYHEDAVNAGRRDANLLERLGPEISRARRLYEERVPADVRSRADHFGQELVRTLANGDPRLLGQAT